MNRVAQWFSDHNKGVRKTCFFVGSFLVVFLIVWLFFSQQGFLARRSFLKTVGQDYVGERVVKVYSGDKLVEQYTGNFSVEQYQGRTSIIDRDTREVTEIYGDSFVLIEASPQYAE